MTLYELTREWEQVFEMLDDPDIPEDAVFDTIEGIEGEIAEKAESYGIVIQSLAAEAEAIKSEKLRLAARQSSLEKRVERLKQSLKTSMEATAQTKIKTTKFSFSIAKTPESVVLDSITDEIWDIYRKEQTRDEANIDKTRLKEALKAGESIPGARLESGTALRIR